MKKPSLERVSHVWKCLKIEHCHRRFSDNIGGVTNAAAVNYGTFIVHGNGTFSSSDERIMRTITHETGHNWDQASEKSRK